MEEIKDKIVARRKALGMTQEQLAQKLGVSAKVVSKWETGRSLPDTAFLFDLCTSLQIAPEELLACTRTIEEENTAEHSIDRGENMTGIHRADRDIRVRRVSPFIYANTIYVLSLPLAAILFGAGIYLIMMDWYGDNIVLSVVLMVIGIVALFGGIAGFSILRTKASERSSLNMDKKNAFHLAVYTYILICIAALIVVRNVLLKDYEGQDQVLFSGLVIGVFILLTLVFAGFLVWNKRRK